MEKISVQELKRKLENKEEFHLIDVREPYEYEEANLGGELIPLGELSDHLDKMEDWKDDEIILMCRSGARSGKAQQFLEMNDFSNVYNLEGGILAWQEMESKQNS